MQEAKIYEELTKIFQNVFDDEKLVLNPGTNATDIDEWDSLNHINLLVAVQANFGIKFQTSELEYMFNVNDLVKMIEKKLSAQK